MHSSYRPRRNPILLLLATALTAPAAQGADIVQLGALTPDSASVPLSINASGTVAGNSGLQGFTWSPTAGMQPVTGVDQLIAVAAINDAGTVVGRAEWPGYNWQGFVKAPGAAAPTYLGSLGGKRSTPAAINNLGTVVGTSVNANFTDHAFRWTPAGGMQDLGSLGGTYAASHATGISDTDVIVGGSSNGPFTRAFLWTQPTGMVDLGTLGGSNSYAYGVSRDGTYVVGWAEAPNGYQHAFRWTSATGMLDLGTFGGSIGLAAAVNNAGAAVGHATDANGYIHPALWTPQLAAPINIDDWLAANDPVAAGQWIIQDLVGINDAGQVIGYGYYFPAVPWGATPPYRAFVLDVSTIPGVALPEPAAATLLGATLCLPSLRRPPRRARRI